MIYKGIASIKYLNSKVADAFQSIKDMEFQDFIHLLAVVKRKIVAGQFKADENSDTTKLF